MSSVDFNGMIGNITNTSSTKTINHVKNNTTKLGTFGFGYTSNVKSFTNKRLPESLITKFKNVPFEKYERNVGQLVISDTDYKIDQEVYDNPYCEI